MQLDLNTEKFNKTIIESNLFYGLSNRKSKVIEECSELIQAIAKLQSLNPLPGSKEEGDLIEHICDEIADVEIVLACFKEYLPAEILQKYKIAKINRLAKRIKI